MVPCFTHGQFLMLRQPFKAAVNIVNARTCVLQRFANCENTRPITVILRMAGDRGCDENVHACALKIKADVGKPALVFQKGFLFLAERDARRPHLHQAFGSRFLRQRLEISFLADAVQWC